MDYQPIPTTSTTAMTAETSSALPSQSQPAGTSRSKLACEACRANKVRCFRGHGFSQACTRCLLQGLACKLPAVVKRRGRPPRSSIDKDSSPPGRPSPDASGSSAFHSAPQMYRSIPHSLAPLIEASSCAQRLPNQWVPTQLTDGQHPNGAAGGVDMRMPHSFPGSNEPLSSDTQADHRSLPEQALSENDKTNLDLSEYLDPEDGTLQINAPNAPFFHNHPTVTAPTKRSDDGMSGAMRRDDPVNLMILSELEAHAMVELFHDRLNYLVAVLDSKLHTLQYLRSTSTVLFCAVLAAASRYNRADLHALLLSHAQTLLDRAITAGAANIGVVQAIMILTYWKKPADTSAWRKIGIALRIGYQLYWHIPRTRPLPEDEMTARGILNAERTWFCLFSFDRGLSQTYGLPVTIRHNHMADTECWARAHLYLGPSVDMHVAFSNESQTETLLAKWFTKECPPPGFDLEKEHIGLWCTLDFLLIIKRHHLENAPSDPSRIDACLSDATKVAEQIEILANNGELGLMQDTESCMTSSLVVLLRNMFHLTTFAQKSLIIDLLQRILHAHTRASSGEANTPTAYVARFIRRTLRAIGMESRAGSPMSGEMRVGDTNMVDGQPEFLAQLQEFMRMPEDVLGANDDEYW